MEYKISIAIATYNGGKYLNEQLNSIYSQSLLPYEVCVIDDCSTDETVSILQEYKEKYGLKFIINERHLGVNQNFEKSLLMTSGDYIMFCDQDDYWLPDKISSMIKTMLKIEEKDKACLVTCRNTYCDSNLKQYNKAPSLEIHLKEDTTDYRDTIIKHLSQGAAMLMNRQTLKYILPFPTNDICYDYYIGYIVAMIGIKYDMKESFIKYRIHENNVTNSVNSIVPHQKFFIKNILNKFNKYHYTGIVPEHSIKVFKSVNEKFYKNIDKEKLKYVNKIISLSDINISLMERLYLLCSTPKIPISRKLNSIKAHILNWFYINK